MVDYHQVLTNSFRGRRCLTILQPSIQDSGKTTIGSDSKFSQRFWLPQISSMQACESFVRRRHENSQEHLCPIQTMAMHQMPNFCDRPTSKITKDDRSSHTTAPSKASTISLQDSIRTVSYRSYPSWISQNCTFQLLACQIYRGQICLAN